MGRGEAAEKFDANAEHVHVQIQGCKDVVIRGEGVLVPLSHHQFSVIDEVGAEEQGSQGGVENVEDFAGHASGQDGEKDEDQEKDEEDANPGGKVPHVLEGEDGNSDTNASADSRGDEYLFCLR